MRIIILTALFFIFLISCQEEGSVIISANLPVKGMERNDSLQKKSEVNFNISKGLLDILSSKEFDLTAKLNMISLNKQVNKIDILNFDKEFVGDTFTFSFDAVINASKAQLLVLQIGALNGVSNKDVDTKSMFAGGKLFRLNQSDEEVNLNLELNPVLSLSGKVITENNRGIPSELDILPAKLKEDDSFLIRMKKFTDQEGNFNFKTIYGIFKNQERVNKFNLVVIAKTEKGIGFNIMGKEHINEEKSDKFNNLITCFLKLNPLGNNCNGINYDELKKYQSGNFMPGIRLNSDIKVYTENRINEGVVTGVSAPKFTVDTESLTSLDIVDGGVYHGTFFLSGFNLSKLFEMSNPNERLNGEIRIYYKNNDDYFYLKYKGAFMLYSIKIVKALRDFKAQIFHNALPFFRLYDLNDREIKLKGVNLKDGLGKDGLFLGIPDIKKIKGEVVRVDFYKFDRNDKQLLCKTVYDNGEGRGLPECK